MQMGKDGLEQARLDFERAVALDPAYAMAHSGLGAAHALRSLNRRVREDLDQARFHLQRALELDRELVEPYPWLCYVHMRTGQIERALAAGHRAIQLQPNLVQAHYFLGLAYFVACEADASHYQSAANHLLDAMRVGPGWQASWFVISFVALMNGDYEHADAFAGRLLEMASQTKAQPFIGAEIVLATVQIRRGNTGAAQTRARFSRPDGRLRSHVPGQHECGGGMRAR
jgi:tetratricopeptide (TPR) repeat protein